MLYFCTVQESHARHTRPISGLDCIRVLHRLGFRIIHRARDLVLMERGRTEPKIARVPRTTSLPEDVLAEILSRAGLCLPLFLELLDKPTKICGCCGYPYSRKAWNTLQRVAACATTEENRSTFAGARSASRRWSIARRASDHALIFFKRERRTSLGRSPPRSGLASVRPARVDRRRPRWRA